MITAEQRDRVPLCGAKRRNGELCRAFAGQGTAHRGTGRCKFHGGNTPTHDKRALRLEATRRMVQLGAPVEDITAIDALLSELYASAGHVSFLRQELSNMSNEQLAAPAGQALVALYGVERDRKVRIARLAIESGVDEAAIRVAEVQVAILGECLMKAADTAGLSAPMRKRLGEALRTELAEAATRPVQSLSVTKQA
jgi:hypothetical protein